MFGYRGFQRILWLLMAQIITLSLFFLFSAFLLTLVLRSEVISETSVAMELAIVAAFLFVLRMAWPVAIEPVELLWGTSAKVRVERWLEPALLWAALATVIAAVLTLFSNISPYLGGIGFLIAALAAAVPLGLSLLLLMSAVRKRKSYQNAIASMKSTLGHEQGLERVEASVANEAGLIETTVKPNPQGFTFAGITSKPWHDPADFPWVEAFENAVEEITEEAENVLKVGKRVTKYDYVGLDGDFWKSFKFVARHKPIAENLAACPTTAALLQTVPGYPSFRDAMFSILDGGGVIKPHRDVSNVFLTLHLPLIAPPNGTIEVGGLKKTWERGKALIFDSSYHHQAINPSKEARIILLVDFLHPDLTESERKWVTEMRL